ncbi:MAG TPA: hypothetical protein VK708_21300, partial [Bryobacteraceae bacterium]|nr:hypothetical protein [Bryobacteraceae bacterium]
MRRSASGVVATLLMAACICSAQPNRSHYIEIKLSPGIISERVFIRYLLTGDDFGDWVQPRPGVTSYFISTTHRPAGQPHQSSPLRSWLRHPDPGPSRIRLDEPAVFLHLPAPSEYLDNRNTYCHGPALPSRPQNPDAIYCSLGSL